MYIIDKTNFKINHINYKRLYINMYKDTFYKDTNTRSQIQTGS